MNPLPGGAPPGSGMRRPPAAEVVAPLRATAAGVAASAAVAAGVVLAARRLSGGFVAAEPGLVWLTLGGGLVLLGIADAGGGAAGQLARAIAARIGLMLGVAAVTLPPRADEWASILALAMAAAVCVLPPPGLRRRVTSRPPRPAAVRSPAPVPPPPRTFATPATSPAATPDEPAALPGPPPAVVAPGPDATSPAGRLQQRLERYESAAGADCVAGHIRLFIVAGSKTTHAHVGFCPAFAATPSVEVTTSYDGVEAVVTAAEVLPWGVRIECRLSEPAEEPLEIPVDLVATSPR